MRKPTINPQGLSRRDSSQQKCFVADEGQIFVFSDLAAAEPTITAYYSKDPNYLACTLHMVGKRPYYNSKGMLVIDDIYLCVASRFVKWKDEIRKAFEGYYDGVQGYDQWLINPESISKGVLKKIRGYAKVIALALAYGLGSKKMVLIAQQNGFELTMTEAKSFRDLYWSTFPLVDKLGKKLITQYNSLGHIMNDFGYCLYPTSDHKVLNALIQSTVSGVMDLFNLIFFTKCQEALYVVNIHDEIIFSIPEDRVAEIKKVFDECVVELNERLGWDVPIRFGWETSKTWDIGK
jgi:DNA polymerase I-like protein with 3'-5' exonuclease and polymerase domains